MNVTTGVVVDGKIVVEGETLPEGKTVGVFIAADAEPYELSPEDADKLDKAIDEVAAGNFVDGDQHLSSLRKQK
jgi:hypothetical protein